MLMETTCSVYKYRGYTCTSNFMIILTKRSAKTGSSALPPRMPGMLEPEALPREKRMNKTDENFILLNDIQSFL